jgi:PAS domain-containing protein
VILRWNAALAAPLGYGDCRDRDHEPDGLHLPHDREAVAAAMREVFETGRDVTIEAEIVDRAGNVRPYLLTRGRCRSAARST